VGGISTGKTGQRGKALAWGGLFTFVKTRGPKYPTRGQENSQIPVWEKKKERSGTEGGGHAGIDRICVSEKTGGREKGWAHEQSRGRRSTSVDEIKSAYGDEKGTCGRHPLQA